MNWRLIASWLTALILALGVNFLLFLTLPFMASSGLTPQNPLRAVNRIDVVKVKKPEKPVCKQVPKNIKQHEKSVKKKVVTPQRVAMKQQIHVDIPSMKFNISADLPDHSPVMLPDLSVQQVGVGIPALDGIFGPGEIDQPLTPLAQAPPMYPLHARRRGLEGAVDIKFMVNRYGTVENVVILKADPENVFEKSVCQCVAGWRFSPGTIEGIPVKTWVKTTIRFELD